MLCNGNWPVCESGKGEGEDGCGLDIRFGLGPCNGFVIFAGPETIGEEDVLGDNGDEEEEGATCCASETLFAVKLGTTIRIDGA